jgi:methionine salvage enolase-phosphatase E1
VQGKKTPGFVVLDIEGTVTPIDFATKTLFPHARMHTAAFLKEAFDNKASQSIFHELRLQAEKVRHCLCELCEVWPSTRQPGLLLIPRHGKVHG